MQSVPENLPGVQAVVQRVHRRSIGMLHCSDRSPPPPADGTIPLNFAGSHAADWHAQASSMHTQGVSDTELRRAVRQKAQRCTAYCGRDSFPLHSSSAAEVAGHQCGQTVAIQLSGGKLQPNTQYCSMSNSPAAQALKMGSLADLSNPSPLTQLHRLHLALSRHNSL